MKRNIGAVPALYPCLVMVVGAMVDGKPSWTLAAHAGTVAHSHLMVSLVKAHYINKGIRENGVVSGNRTDKSEAFSYSIGENGAPIINDAKVSIECEVDGNYELENFDNFICRIQATYADDCVLNADGKIDYHVFKPVLFEFPTYEYFVTGDAVGRCGRMNG